MRNIALPIIYNSGSSGTRSRLEAMEITDPALMAILNRGQWRLSLTWQVEIMRTDSPAGRLFGLYGDDNISLELWGQESANLYDRMEIRATVEGVDYVNRLPFIFNYIPRTDFGRFVLMHSGDRLFAMADGYALSGGEYVYGSMDRPFRLEANGQTGSQVIPDLSAVVWNSLEIGPDDYSNAQIELKQLKVGAA